MLAAAITEAPWDVLMFFQVQNPTLRDSPLVLVQQQTTGRWDGFTG